MEFGRKTMVYTASCGALAAIEYLAQKILPENLLLLVIEFPDQLSIDVVSFAPVDQTATRRIGDEWLDSKSSAVLKVPSVLVPRQTNYLFNPAHPLFETIKVVAREAFAFDSRLYKV